MCRSLLLREMNSILTTDGAPTASLKPHAVRLVEELDNGLAGWKWWWQHDV